MIHCLDVKKYPKDNKALPMGSDFPVDEFLVKLLTTDDSNLPTNGTDVEELPDGMKFAVGSKLLATNGGTESKEYVFDGNGFVEWIVPLISGGGGLEYESGIYIPEVDIQHPFISFSKSHATPPIIALAFDVTGNYDSVVQTPYISIFIDLQLCGCDIWSGAASKVYGMFFLLYRSTSVASLTSTSYQCSRPRGEYVPEESNQGDPQYYTANNGMYLSAGSSTTQRDWRAGRSYKWIAIWAPEA